MSSVVIVDYGVGNIGSVQKAFAQLGYETVLSGDASIIESADLLVLPGQGAFASTMGRLEERGLSTVIEKYIRAQRYF